MMNAESREILIDAGIGIFALVYIFSWFKFDPGVLEVPEYSTFGLIVMVAAIIVYPYLDKRIEKVIDEYGRINDE